MDKDGVVFAFFLFSAIGIGILIYWIADGDLKREYCKSEVHWYQATEIETVWMCKQCDIVTNIEPLYLKGIGGGGGGGGADGAGTGIAAGEAPPGSPGSGLSGGSGSGSRPYSKGFRRTGFPSPSPGAIIQLPAISISDKPVGPTGTVGVWPD